MALIGSFVFTTDGDGSFVGFADMAWQMVLARRFMGCASLDDIKRTLAVISQKVN